MAGLAVPGVIAGLAASGMVAVASSSTATGSATSVMASPAPVTSPTTDDSVQREQGTSRSTGRPVLSPKAAAQAEAAKKAKAKAAKAEAAKKAKAKAAKAEAAKKAEAKAAAARAAKARAAAASMKIVDTEYTRVALNVRADADAGSRLITVLSSGSKVSVTPTVVGVWQHISYRGNGGWVKKQYLVESKPKVASSGSSTSSSSSSGSSSSGGGISGAACSGGSGVESGLTPDAVRVHRAICARFPAVKSYGGVRADSLPEHPSGRALDAMVSGTDLGWQIAKWVRANAKQLGVSQVLFAQHIWTVQRGSEGWRTFSDRGSATANHYDHVHVTVYGSSGG